MRSIAAGALDRVDNPAAWLYRSARNAVIDHYRTRHVHDPLGPAAEMWPEPEPADDRPNDATRDLAACLQPLVARLPEIYRDALDRVDLAGQSHHDAAVEVGISTSGMKSRVQRARRLLKGLLTDCCAVQVDRLGAVSSLPAQGGPLRLSWWRLNEAQCAVPMRRLDDACEDATRGGSQDHHPCAPRERCGANEERGEDGASQPADGHEDRSGLSASSHTLAGGHCSEPRFRRPATRPCSRRPGC